MKLTDLINPYSVLTLNAEGGAGAGGDGGAAPAPAGGAAPNGEAAAEGAGGADTALTGDQDKQNSSADAGDGGEESPKNSQDGKQGDEPGESSGEFSIDAPENLGEEQVELITAFNSDVQSYLKENPDATASDALKWVAERQIEAVQKGQEDAANQFADQVEQWGESLKTDKEFGGDKYDANMASAKSVIDKFGTPELTQLLNESGLGNHPEMVRFVYRISQPMKDSPVFTGGGTGTDTRTFTEKMYPKS